MPLVFKTAKWSKADREALLTGVRNEMKRAVMEHTIDPEGDTTQRSAEINAMSDEALVRATEDLPLDWGQVVKFSKLKRDPAACRVQWAQVDNPLVRNESLRWDKEEEIGLLELAKSHDHHEWTKIAAELGTQRTPAACLMKYQRTLNGESLRSGWNKEEDEKLCEAVTLYGTKNWQQVAMCLKNRSSQQCQFRWCKRSCTARWSPC